MTTEPSTTPKPRRCWLQYSLRTMMVLMLGFGCGLGWLAREVHQVRAQRVAAERIAELGGRVNWEAASGDIMRTAVTQLGQLSGQAISEDVVAVIGEFRLGDEGLAYVHALKHLKALLLYDTPVSNAGLAHLRGLTRLEHLDLRSTQVSDAGLVHL